MTPETLERPIAFVFSGGSSLGALQVGMLQALLEAGVEPDLIVGSSVGALNGAYIAQGQLSERVEELVGIWQELRTKDVFGGLSLAMLWRIATGKGPLASARRLQNLIDSHIPEKVEALEISMFAIATDVCTGKIVPLSEGNLQKNVLASAAIPAVFPVVELDDRSLVDGGVSSNVPMQTAHENGARSMIILDAGAPCQLEEPPEGLLATTLHAVSLMLRQQSLSTLTMLSGQLPILYMPVPCPLSVPSHDFSHGAELIESARKLGRRFLAEVEIDGAGVYGVPHVH